MAITTTKITKEVNDSVPICNVPFEFSALPTEFYKTGPQSHEFVNLSLGYYIMRPRVTTHIVS